MSFVTLKNFDQVALSEVLRMKRTPRGLILTLKSGEFCEVEEGAWERALRLDVRAAIPAPPGYFLLTTCGDDDGRPDYLEQEPVIGWVFSAGGIATAVTAEGVDDYDRAVLAPDGRVIYGDGSSDTIEAYAAAKGVAPRREAWKSDS